MWTYQCRVLRVVDGDTLDILIDLGFYSRLEARVRLAGLDTAEIYGVKHESDEYEEGMVHKRFVEDWVDAAPDQDWPWPFVVRTEKQTGKYGRWIGELERKADDEVLNQTLLAEFPSVED